MKKVIETVLICFNFLNYTNAQDTKPFTPEGDARYYDFWPGKWFVRNEDKTIDSLNYFEVKIGVHEASFIEDWQGNSVALRSWDKINNKWGFVWVSGNGLYQVWDSKKIDDHWYIYNQFTINGETYISRQSFIHQANGTVIRLSEKSIDGNKWEKRFIQILVKQN